MHSFINSLIYSFIRFDSPQIVSSILPEAKCNLKIFSETGSRNWITHSTFSYVYVITQQFIKNSNRDAEKPELHYKRVLEIRACINFLFHNLIQSFLDPHQAISQLKQLLVNLEYLQKCYESFFKASF